MTGKNEMRVPKSGGSPTRSFHLEASRAGRGMSVIISGIIGISDFSETSVSLKTHTGCITVGGERISISAYEGGAVEIVGKVEEIKFAYGKN